MDRWRRVVGGLGVVACLWTATPVIAAPDSMGGKQPTPTANSVPGGDPVQAKTYYEHGILSRSGEDVEALGPNLMGDQVNPYSGDLSFTQVDVTIPGNSALAVQVTRRRNASTIQAYQSSGLFGDWDLDVPHLYTISSATQPNWYGGGAANNLNRCTQFRQPPLTSISTSGGSMVYDSRAFWDGYHLHVPGKGDQTLLLRGASNAIAPAAGATVYPVVTKEHWQISCLPTLDTGAGGEAFVARSPDGVVHRFDHMITRGWPQVKVGWSTGAAAGIGFIQRSQVIMLPTLITDRFGNWVRYTYAGAGSPRVTSIQSSDGRTILFAYSGATNRIQSASDGTRTWIYGYSASGQLQTVTQPDSSQWQFAAYTMSPEPFNSPDPSCDLGWEGNVLNDSRSWTMTHPSGAVGTFTLVTTAHGRSNVPGTSSCGFNTNPTSTYFASRSITSKTLSGPGMSAMTWQYAYSPAAGSFAPCTGCIGTKTVTTTDPLGNVNVSTYGTQFNVNEGLLLTSAEGVGANGVAARTTTFEYRPSSAGPYPASLGSVNAPADTMSRVFTPISRRVIYQDGAAFTHDATCSTCFDGLAREVTWTAGSDLGFSRAEATTYSDNSMLWVLGQVAMRKIAGQNVSETMYDSATALPSSHKKFGKLHSTYGFSADGTLATIKDGLNKTTTFSDYKRGLPRYIGYADGRGVSAVINDIGTIASVTNEFGTTWTYGYDPMGRLASKTAPQESAGPYNTTTLSFVQVGSPEQGLEANHWRQTITTGNAVTINYFDARWRKRVTLTYDSTDQVNTQRMQRFKFDPYNRTTSASYPARSLPLIDTYSGTLTTYDPLGRVKQTQSDSELGTLTTTIEYLSGFRKRVTDARGFASTTSYQVFDEPEESAIVQVLAPEGLTVSIGRDIFGKPTSIARSGTYGGAAVNAVRRYVYDVNHLLCKTIEPEAGATVQALDAANNVSWRATGLSLTDPASCDYASVPSNRVIGYTYDARNRLTGTGFGDGGPAIGRSYTPDGLPWTITAGGSTLTYAYNNRRLLTNEKLDFNGGGSWAFGRNYNSNGHESQLSYADGSIVVFAPNALGEATQVGGYAGGVTYHPNGAVATYTLGNGVAHSLTQNVRGLPFVNRDAGIVQDQYAYDPNGNIVSIADQQEGVTNRTMSYDGLDRLTVANAPSVWGSGTYSYDALGNLRTSVVGARSSAHNYNANNRLQNINTNGAYTGYAFDANGNVTGRGTRGYYFDLGNRMQLASGVASYSYDGLGRRANTSKVDGTNMWHYYSAAGQMLMDQQQQGSSTSTTRYIYLAGKAIAQTDSITGTSYLYTDAIGSPVARTGTVPATVTFSCPSGWTLSGNTCTQSTSTTIAATVTGYSCPLGYSLTGSTCSQATTVTSAATPNYGCPAGWALSGSNCSYSVAASPVFSCPSGFTLSGTTCSGTSTSAATTSLDCRGNGSLQPLSWSPTGYYCTTRTVNKLAYDGCPDLAPSGLPYLGFRQNGTNTVACYFGPVIVYSCPSGSALSGTSCTTPVSQQAGISSYTCSSGTLSGGSCVTTSTANLSYSCPAGQALSGSNCLTSSTNTVAGTPIYACPSNYSLSGSSCSVLGTSTVAATAGFTCASGTLSGSSCLGALSRTRYEPYGNVAAGTVPNALGFTGHVNDAETGLIYMQQRYYDPIAGRFQSVDPLITDAESGKSFNRYEYVNSNPFRFTDPDGRDGCTGSHITNSTGGCSSSSVFTPQGMSSVAISGASRPPVPAAAAAGSPAQSFSPPSGIAAASSAAQAVKYWLSTSWDAAKSDGVGGAIERTLAGIPGEAMAVGVISKIGKIEQAAQGAAAADTVFKSTHYASRLEKAGVSIAKAEAVVLTEVNAMRGHMAIGADTVGRVTVDGVQLQYRARLLSNGTINVGTVYPLK